MYGGIFRSPDNFGLLLRPSGSDDLISDSGNRHWFFEGSLESVVCTHRWHFTKADSNDSSSKSRGKHALRAVILLPSRYLGGLFSQIDKSKYMMNEMTNYITSKFSPAPLISILTIISILIRIRINPIFITILIMVIFGARQDCMRAVAG